MLRRLVDVTVDIERNEVSEEDHDTEEEDSLSSESESLEDDKNLVSLDIESFIWLGKCCIKQAYLGRSSMNLIMVHPPTDYIELEQY